MASRRGKHSLKQITSRSYEGASASQKVRAAEWSGQFAWNNGNHSSPMASNASWNGTHVDVDYDKPWFEQDEHGEWKCNLCGAYATEGHLASDRHVQRSRNPEWYGYGQGVGETAQPTWQSTCGTCQSAGGYDSAVYDKPWFERKDGEWYCNLCGNWATEGHIASNKHQNRAEAPQHYGYSYPNPQEEPPSNGLPPGWTAFFSEEHQCDYYHHEDTGETTWDKPAGAVVSATALVPYYHKPPEYDAPWFERKEHGEYYCNLCHNWATEGHIASDKHRKRAEFPEWYGYAPRVLGSASLSGEAISPMVSASSALPRRETEGAPPKVPKPWVPYWSEEHNAYYFHNPTTDDTTWEKPIDFAD